MREMAPEQAGAEKVPFETSVPLEIDDGYSFLDDDSLLFRAGSWLLHWFALVVLTIYNRLFFGLRTVGFQHLRCLPGASSPSAIMSICWTAPWLSLIHI